MKWHQLQETLLESWSHGEFSLCIQTVENVLSQYDGMALDT